MFQELVHKPDLQNGYYMNPIMDGDYADPAVMRDGENFYLCASTGMYYPALTIYHSTDLVNWHTLCHPLTKFDGHAWAPDILKHGDTYYIYFCAEGTNWVIHSKEIDKGWSVPIDLKVGHLDPGHCVDLEGNRLLFVSDNCMIPLTPDGLTTCGELKKVLQAPKIPDEFDIEGEFPEAPNFFKHGGYYYLTYADGGTTGPATSHMIMSARAKDPHGPWEMSPYNPVVHTYHRHEKWISKGHGHFVDDIDGSWWVIYHAYENGLYTAGRKLLLSPVEFTKDGWFTVKTPADVATKKPAGKTTIVWETLSDAFDTVGEMPNQWRSLGALQEGRLLRTESGLQFKAVDAIISKSHPMTIITGDRSFEITVEVSTKTGCEAGLGMFYNPQWFDAISLKDGVLSVYRLFKQLGRKEIGCDSCTVKMKNDEGYLSFWYSLDGVTFQKLNYVIDITAQTTQAYNGFASLRPGIFAVGAEEATFNNFSYVGLK